MVWAVINGPIALAAVRRVVAGRSRLKIDFRLRIVALKLMSAKQIPIVPRGRRDLVWGGRRGDAGGVLSQQDGRKLHNALAFARAFAVL
jgi:hypothetical protein